MKVTIERASLLRSLAHVQSVVERRNTIPILSNVLIEAGEGKMTLTATDMDLTVLEEVIAEVRTPGATTAPAHVLYDIVRKLPEGAQVELVGEGDRAQLKLTSGRSSFQLSTLPKDDFPPVGAGGLPINFALPQDDLCHLIDRTRFAISTEETRYYLNGIYLHVGKSEDMPVLRAAATDGHRLARFQMPLPDGADAMPGIILPRKTVGELRKLLEGSDQKVRVSLSDSKITFALNGAVLISKLIDGTFPDYERVIPFNNDKIMHVDRRSFLAAVDRVSTISTEKSRAVKLSLGSGVLVLSATSPDSGSASEEIEVDYGDERLEIGFNARYLLDIAQQIQGDGAQFLMTDGASPTIVRDTTDSSALYVLMPMRV